MFFYQKQQVPKKYLSILRINENPARILSFESFMLLLFPVSNNQILIQT